MTRIQLLWLHHVVMIKGVRDRADRPSEQGPINRLGEFHIVQFISDAVRSGQRAILITDRGQVSARVPEAALVACSSASARTLHIGPPLPEPPELQEMIGAVLGIAGGRELAPRAMAERLETADPSQTVILAIDDAHMLSDRSLSYLSLMTELLTAGTPVLQIVLSAGPTLLDRLAQPEYESLRKRLFRPRFETPPTLRGAETNGVFSDTTGERAVGRVGAHPAHLRDVEPPEYRVAHPAVHAVAGFVAMGCLAAIGYTVFPVFSAGSTPPNIQSIDSAASQEPPAPSDLSQSSTKPDHKQTGERVDLLIDQLMGAVASGSVKSTSPLLERVANLETSATPDALKLWIALPDRFAARIAAATAAGRVDEAHRLEQFYSRHSLFLRLAYSAPNEKSPLRAAAGASAASPIVDPPGLGQAEQSGAPPSGSALSAGQLGSAGDGDRAALSPNRVGSAASSAASDQDIERTQSPLPSIGAPPATLSEEQRGGAGNGDQVALSRDAVARAASAAPPDQNVEVAQPAKPATVSPPAPAAGLSSEQPGEVGTRDRVRTGLAATPDQNVEVAQPAIAATAEPAAPSAGPSAERRGGADPTAPAVGVGALDQDGDAAQPRALAKGAPTRGDGPIAPSVAGLPRLAPLRVLLSVARDDIGHAGRSTELQHVLVDAGLGVAEFVPVDTQQLRPSIGYYFESDRDPAARVSRLLQPLLGAVDPVALRKRGAVPEPGTIEIAIP